MPTRERQSFLCLVERCMLLAYQYTDMGSEILFDSTEMLIDHESGDFILTVSISGGRYSIDSKDIKIEEARD